MRISRKKRPKKLLIPQYLVNRKITAEELRVLGPEGENLDVMSKAAALEKAAEHELDLVEINPKANPPVAQIMDFKHFKYRKEKQARKRKQQTHVSEVKGIRLSMRIGKGDLEVRKKQSIKFLERGDKVKIEIILRGAERYKTPLAYEVIQDFITMLSEDISLKTEQPATRQGNKITALIVKE